MIFLKRRHFLCLRVPIYFDAIATILNRIFKIIEKKILDVY